MPRKQADHISRREAIFPQGSNIASILPFRDDQSQGAMHCAGRPSAYSLESSKSHSQEIEFNWLARHTPESYSMPSPTKPSGLT